MAHVDTAEEAVPVGVVGLAFPEMAQAGLLPGPRFVDSIVDAEHLFVLRIDLGIAYQEVAPEATAHEL